MVERGGIFKIGGKLFEDEKSLRNIIMQLRDLYDSKIFDKIIIIPGGGKLANFVRLVDQKLELGSDLSHWMAILAMDINGKLISHSSKIKCTTDLKEIEEMETIFTVFLPYSFLRENDMLPHDWQVTSDSITLYLSHVMKFNTCYLIKDVDGILLSDGHLKKNLTTEEYMELKKENKLLNNMERLKKSQPIDNYLPTIIDKFKIPCVVLNGLNKAISNFFNHQIDQEHNAIFTKLNPK